jgi:hypothetical protein
MNINDHGNKETPIQFRVRLGVILANEQVRGEIISLSITLEAILDEFLSRYFAHKAKEGEFERIVLTKMTISQKIDVLRGIDFPKTLKSFLALVSIYQGVNRLRNHCAHAHWGDGDKIAKLADNEFIRNFVDLRPHPITSTTRSVRRLIASLSKSKHFLRKDFDDVDIPF